MGGILSTLRDELVVFGIGPGASSCPTGPDCTLPPWTAPTSPFGETAASPALASFSVADAKECRGSVECAETIRPELSSSLAVRLASRRVPKAG